VELELVFMDSSLPISFSARVGNYDSAKHLVEIELDKSFSQKDIEEWIFAKSQAKPFQSKVKIELEELEELLDAEPEDEPEVVIKPKQKTIKSKTYYQESKEQFSEPKERALQEEQRQEQITEPADSGAFQNQEAEKELIEKQVKPEKKEGELEFKKEFTARALKEHLEISPEGADALERLKIWLAPSARGKQAKEVKREIKQQKEPVLKEQEELKGPISYGSLNRFVQSLVKAMLRSGYYSPDHPGARQAKAGLYQEFLDALGESSELGFTLQRRVGEAPEIIISRGGEEPISLKKLLGAGASELFFPKYLDYFDRKKLVSFTIKAGISQEKFERFVDIMSDPAVDQGEPSEAGRLLTRQLVDAGISEISAVFEDDLIVIEAKLPWRVEMAIQRLAKDLKVLPMFKEIDDEKLRELKEQIVKDILRPLRQPELLKDILLNAYLIARAVPEIDEEDLEEAIIKNFPMNMLIPSSKYISAELKRLAELAFQDEQEREIVEQRIESVKRMLRNIAQRVVVEEVEGAEDFLEELFEFKILSFDELPPEVQERINLKKMAQEFEANPQYWLSKAKEANKKDALELFLKFFSKIIPLLRQKKSWQSLFLIAETLHHIKSLRKDILEEIGINDPIAFVWKEQLYLFVRDLLGEKPSVLKGLKGVFSVFGELGLEALFKMLLETKEPSKRKALFELIFEQGEEALERFRSIAQDPTKSAPVQALALQALGRAGDVDDAELVERFLTHSQPELRSEAITALVRIEGEKVLKDIMPLLKDPEPSVRRRVIAVLGGFAHKIKTAREKLQKLVFDQEESPFLRATSLRELESAFWESEEEKDRFAEEVLDRLFEKSGLRARLRAGIFQRDQSELELKLAGIELAGKLGGKDTLKRLSQLKFSDAKLSQAKESALNRLKLRLKG